MKKVFLSALSIFTLSLMFCLSYQKDDFSKNSAFADEAVCCYEEDSVCGLNGGTQLDRYHLKGRICPSIGGGTVVEITP